jgi:hypothetical protein
LELIPFYQRIKIPFNRQIPLIVNKIINRPRFGGIDARKIVKVKTGVQQFGFGAVVFSLGFRLDYLAHKN